MTQRETRPRHAALLEELNRIEGPLLVLSTVVGRGMYTLADAVRERIDPGVDTHHIPVEDLLPCNAVREDLVRYKAISSRFPLLLNIVYRIPWIYLRKKLRERYLRTTNLDRMKNVIHDRKIRTVLCVSHRPAFWISCLLQREGLDLTLVGLSGEYGSSLGWRYIFWDEMNTFLSPLPQETLRFPLSGHLRFREVDLPARKAYYRLAARTGDPKKVLLVCGFWGQGPMIPVLESLLAVDPELVVYVVCGENEAVRSTVKARYGASERVRIYGVAKSLEPLLEACGSIVTKPGISTLLESHAAGRKIFLLKGMPVAEDHNLHHALSRFGAERYAPEGFRRWLQSQGAPEPPSPRVREDDHDRP